MSNSVQLESGNTLKCSPELCFVLYKCHISGLCDRGFHCPKVSLCERNLSLALAFYKPNGKPFINMLEAGFKYFTQSKLYIWQERKGEEAKARVMAGAAAQTAVRTGPKLTNSKLRDLAWSLDVLDTKK